jgi:2-dehydro-3-deoxygalactonokinase
VSGSAIIGDWGNSRLRLWRLEGGRIAERREGPGMAQTGDPAATLAGLLDSWDHKRVVLCGMVGARGGLRETPYLDCPAGLEAWAREAAHFKLAGRDISVAAGLTGSNDNGRPDVMRGEETQIFGALALDPGLAVGQRLMVLPGTHSKWARVTDGVVTGFTTHMTGELFDLLGASTLSLAGDLVANDDDEGFTAGLARAEDGTAFTSGLFEARAAQLCAGKPPAWARGFVSGLLVGTEIGGGTLSGLDCVVLIGEPLLSTRYREALRRKGVEAVEMAGEECAIAGLRLLDGRD